MNAEPPRDVHRWTVYHHPGFQQFMDHQFGYLWRTWPFRRARLYAKTWRWARVFLR